MNRRAVLVALGGATVGSAGCLASEPPGSDDEERGASDRQNGSNSTEGSVLAAFDGETDRPECEVESETVEVEIGEETRAFETAGTIPYPDAPDKFDRDEHIAFVEAFEEAYVTHDAICNRAGSGHVLSVGYNVETSETFDSNEDATTAFLLRAGGVSSGLDGGGRLWEAELPYAGVVYAVDETGAARADFEQAGTLDEDELESEAPDPLEAGDLVARFD